VSVVVGEITPPSVSLRVFEQTMASLDAGLTVADIATFDLGSCSIDEDAQAALARADVRDFDWIPVVANDVIVGVLERGSEPEGPAVKSMRPLDDSVLVSASEPLKGFIPVLAITQYRLVVQGSSIKGIVTASDLQKLPVRLLIFALVTHVEMTMANAVEIRMPDDSWVGLLNETRRTNLSRNFNRLRRGSYDPPMIDVAEFCDKRSVLRKLRVLSKRDEDDFKAIEGLRNRVAHAASYAENAAELGRLVQLMEIAENWITRLSYNHA
jgi:predicted transcriptional regulator